MRQITRAPHGHILTNSGVWSPDGAWIVYDVRSDPAGTAFDGDRIEAVNVASGEIQLIHRSGRGAHCGVASWHPREPKIVFILGPEFPTPAYSYGPSRRRGVIVDQGAPGVTSSLDARDLVPPFTPGALRGGTHLHQFSPDGTLVSFTYDEDIVGGGRSVGVCYPHATCVPKDHPRNYDGEYFAVLVSQTTRYPRAGSDEISRACEEAWVGTNAIAFQGDVVAASGETVREVFIVELPQNLSRAGDGPIEGTETRRPFPPAGTVQRRLTFTAERKFPGIQGPRHWLRSSPDGSRIAMLMKDDDGVVQLWTISPDGSGIRQVTGGQFSVASAFTWTADGMHLTHLMDRSVCVTNVATGGTTRLTERVKDAVAPRPEACVTSPDGTMIAFVRPVRSGAAFHNQIFVVCVVG